MSEPSAKELYEALCGLLHAVAILRKGAESGHELNEVAEAVALGERVSGLYMLAHTSPLADRAKSEP